MADNRRRRAAAPARAPAYGFGDVHADWRELVARDDLDLVSVTGPELHPPRRRHRRRRAGRQALWLEKPAGRDAGETREIADAVTAAGVQSAVGFNYRNAPAVELARQLVADGRLGRVEHVRDPAAGRLRRPSRRRADLALRERAGRLRRARRPGQPRRRPRPATWSARSSELVCDTAIFIPERPGPAGRRPTLRPAAAARCGPVRERGLRSARCSASPAAPAACWSPAGSRSASSARTGSRCTATAGALAWDFRRMGELQLCARPGLPDAAYVTQLRRPRRRRLAAFQPGAGIAMGYDDLKVIEVHRLVRSIATGAPSRRDHDRRGRRGPARRRAQPRRPTSAAGSTSTDWSAGCRTHGHCSRPRPVYAMSTRRDP